MSFRHLFDGMGVGVLVADLSTLRFIHANPAICRMFGYEDEALVGRHLHDIHPTADLPRVIDEFEAQSRGEKLTVTDIPCLRKDGSVFHADISSNGLVMGEVPCVIGVFTDVTERRRALAALGESEDRLRALSDNLPGGLVYQVDSGPDGTTRRFTYLSAGVEALHGITAEAAQRDPMEIYGQLVEEDLAAVVEAERAAVARMGPFRAEARVRLPDGGVAWRLFTSAPRRFPDGHLIWDGIEVDITASKQVEVELREKARLEERLREAQKLESIGRLAGGVAHDYNNMLGVILGHVELMLETVGAADPIRADLEEVRAAAVRSAELTRQLLAFASRQAIRPRRLFIHEIFTALRSTLKRLVGDGVVLDFIQAGGNDVLDFIHGDAAWPVSMDPTQLEQVLTNLCVNARDAVGGAGRVTVTTENRVIDEAFVSRHPQALPGEFVRLSVSDDGCGMDPEVLSRIFEPFYTTKALGRGTGLGLATVYGIVQQNRGFNLVESAPGKGSSFQVFFPRARG